MIVFRAPSRGQGIGNSLHGLMAAYSLAHIFNKHVCIEWSRYNRFVEEDTCPRTDTEVQYFNFGSIDSRKRVLDKIAAHENVAFRGNNVWNTSQRFPHMFDEFCKQFNVTAYSTVAHIRTGDNRGDRRGILRAKDGWSIVQTCLPAYAHIITDDALTFKMLNKTTRSTRGHSEMGRQSIEDLRGTWFDWCTFRHARTLYHTPSGFSESSIYFSRPKKVIRMDEKLTC